eukprot:scaffold79915_cov20-Prasinocladus_malaysianus.AAC.1
MTKSATADSKNNNALKIADSKPKLRGVTLIERPARRHQASNVNHNARQSFVAPRAAWLPVGCYRN